MVVGLGDCASQRLELDFLCLERAWNQFIDEKLKFSGSLLSV